MKNYKFETFAIDMGDKRYDCIDAILKFTQRCECLEFHNLNLAAEIPRIPEE